MTDYSLVVVVAAVLFTSCLLSKFSQLAKTKIEATIIKLIIVNMLESVQVPLAWYII